MGSAFHQLCPRYSGTLTPTAPTAIRLWDTFTFLLDILYRIHGILYGKYLIYLFRYLISYIRYLISSVKISYIIYKISIMYI